MFTSKNHLHQNMGVNIDIAAFFVDRKVPANNSYWKGRLLYVSGGTGYLFIPLFFDLQNKCGANLEQVLEEEYIRLMEFILDSAAMYEFKQIDFSTHIDNCKRILKNRVKNKILFNDLVEYFSDDSLKAYKNLGTSSKALNRGDTFLFVLCYLDLPEETTKNIIEKWYALVPSFLLMDDIMDLRDDQEKNEENAVSDFGAGAKGIENALEFLRIKFGQLKTVNQQLGNFFEISLKRKMETPYMQSILNN